ncbi:hypothetical protein [Neobacillus vireti]|uniref:hypothetical protein n=1 Tax=Neobacillus vireti TaxID=220686 RepID=UPI002FFFAD44
MKKAWLAYHLILLLFLSVMMVLHFMVNGGRSEHDINIYFVGISIWVSVLNIVIAFPIWIAVILFNRHRMNKRTFLIGLSLFLLFFFLSILPFAEMLGYMSL